MLFNYYALLEFKPLVGFMLELFRVSYGNSSFWKHFYLIGSLRLNVLLWVFYLNQNRNDIAAMIPYMKVSMQ